MSEDYKAKGVTIRHDVMEVLDKRPDLEFQADKILPPLYERRTGGQIFVMGAGEGKKNFDTKRAKNGSYASGDWRLQKDSFESEVHGFEMRVDLIEAMVMGEILDERLAASQMARDTLFIDREFRVSQAVFNTTTFATAKYTLAVANKYDTDLATIKADIKVGADAIKKRMGIGKKMLSYICNDELIDEMVTNISKITSISNNVALELEDEKLRTAALVRYLGIKEIVSVSSLYDTTGLNTDSDAEFDDMWRKDYAMLAALSPTTNSWKAGGLGRQPTYAKLTKDWVAESYFNPVVDGEVMRVKDYRGEKVFKDFGFLFTGLL